MGKQFFSLAIYSGIIIVLVLFCAWGWYLYFNSSEKLSDVKDKLRYSIVKLQQLTDGNNRLIEISRSRGESDRTIKTELGRAREIVSGLIADRQRRDREISAANERGRSDIKRVIDLATGYQGELERLYRDYRALGEIPTP